MPVSEDAERPGRLSYEEQSECLVKDRNFLDFYRNSLKMDNELIESFKFRADFCDDIKREHILQSFKRGLRDTDIYELIDFYRGKGCWERVAFEKFGVQMSQTDKASAQRELSEEQKRSMLYHWFKSQESHQEAQRIFNIKYNEFKLSNRVF